MFISISYCTATILNNNNNIIKKCGKRIFELQSNEYSIIYNNGYNLINYTNLSKFIEHKNISILKRDIDILKLNIKNIIYLINIF